MDTLSDNEIPVKNKKYPEDFNNPLDISDISDRPLIVDKIKDFIMNDQRGKKDENIQLQAELYFENVLSDLGSENAPFITKTESKDHYITVYYLDENDNTQSRTYDLLDKMTNTKFSTYQELYNVQQEVLISLPGKLEKMDKILIYMEDVFEQNENKPGLGYINNFDTLKSQKGREQFNGDNLQELQSKFLFIYKQVLQSKSILHGQNLPFGDEITSLQKKFLKMTIGIGDKYEGGADYLNADYQVVRKTVSDIIMTGTNTQALDYLKMVHNTIDENNYQSTAVEKSYNSLNQMLNDFVLKKLSNNLTTTQANYLEFVKIISGKYGSDGDLMISESTETTINLVLEKLMYKRGGIMEKMTESTVDSFTDPEMEGKNPRNVVKDAIKLVNKYVVDENGEAYDFERELSNIGYQDVFDIGDQKYEELSLDTKSKISVLVRLIKKLPQNFIQTNYGRNRGDYTINKQQKKLDLQGFSNLFREISVDTQEDLLESLTDAFQDYGNPNEFLWGKELSEYINEDTSISKLDKEVFQFFQDFQGVGLLNVSDRSFGNIKEGGKIGLIIGSAIVAPYIFATITSGAAIGSGAVVGTYSVLKIGAIVGATATATSIAINPKGYDSGLEAIVDISTEATVGIATGIAGGALVKNFGIQGAKFISRGNARNSTIFAGDLLLLGIGAEVGRTYGMNAIFQKDSLYE